MLARFMLSLAPMVVPPVQRGRRQLIGAGWLTAVLRSVRSFERRFYLLMVIDMQQRMVSGRLKRGRPGP